MKLFQLYVYFKIYIKQMKYKTVITRTISDWLTTDKYNILQET